MERITVQECKVQEQPAFEATLQPLDVFQVASKFETDDCYEIWPIKFWDLYSAKQWIKHNHPDSARIGMEWVIIRMD